MKLQIQFIHPLWLQLLLECVIGIVLALLLRRFVCMLAFVKGRSMQDTLRDGEIVFARRRTFRREIRRFDVVLCKYPNRKGLFVKRVVALTGERVAMEEGILYINGEAVEESFARRVCMRPMPERTVPEGCCFVMGDNRPASRDSRSVGAIPWQDVVAVVKCVVFPLSRARKIR